MGIMSKNAKKFITDLFEISGITINGSKPYDITVHNEDFYNRIVKHGELGLGESYIDRWWEAGSVDQFIDKILRKDLEDKVKKNIPLLYSYILAQIFNRQSKKRAFQVGECHYDIGEGLYTRMLDKQMQYTCGYWKNATTLDQAQENKLDLICRKLDLNPGMKILELGCGYGAFAKYAAQKYKVHVTGYTVSKDQARFGRELNKNLDVDIKFDDYRNAEGLFDRVISIGLMEHVGYKNYRTYMKKVHSTLKDDGIAFIHTIGNNITKTSTNAWIDKYIFPNGRLPSIRLLGKAMEGMFVVEDWHNFGEHYDKTLMAWYKNFKDTWPEIEHNYSKRFYRMWEFYLLSCAGGFRARTIQLWQIIMTKTGKPAPECRKS